MQLQLLGHAHKVDSAAISYGRKKRANCLHIGAGEIDTCLGTSYLELMPRYGACLRWVKSTHIFEYLLPLVGYFRLDVLSSPLAKFSGST